MNVLVIAMESERWQKPLQWIRDLGWEIILKPSCREGLKELEKNLEIDVILVDTETADDSGLKLMHNVKVNRRLHWLPFLIVGERLEADLVWRCRESGVTNIVILPTSKETFQAKLLKASEEGRPTVLVVDDEEFLRDLLRDILALERYRVETAASAEEALELLQQKRFDAIISDIMMPGKSGMELLAEAKQVRPDLPVILITGYAGQFTSQSAIGCGADGYFSKPFKNIELSYTLRAVLEKPRRIATV